MKSTKIDTIGIEKADKEESALNNWDELFCTYIFYMRDGKMTSKEARRLIQSEFKRMPENLKERISQVMESRAETARIFLELCKPKEAEVLSNEEKLKVVSKAIQGPTPHEFTGHPQIYYWIGHPALDGSLLLIISYARGSLGFDTLKYIAGRVRDDDLITLRNPKKPDECWTVDFRESNVYRKKLKPKDPFTLLNEEVKWLKLKIGGIKKKYL